MRSVTLGTTRYKVRVVKDAQRHLARAGEPAPVELNGYLHKKRKEIVIEEQDERQMSTSLLHEMLHAVLPYLHEDAIRETEEKLFPVLRRHGFRPF